MDVHDILSRLSGVHSVSGGWIACCPSHADSNPSMSVTQKDGKILLHCHAGCPTEDIVGALGMKMSDLMPPPVERAKPPKKTPPRPVARYDYQNENGDIVYSVIRYEPKTFRQCRYDEHGSPVWKMDGVKRVPYHLPEVIAAASVGGDVIVCEGEKDVETLRNLGFVATCNAGGAGKWDAEWSRFFTGAGHVWVVADNDPADKGFPGQKHAWGVYQSMTAAGVPASVLVMPCGKDVTEWAQKTSAQSGEDFTRAISAAAPWPAEWRFSEEQTEQKEYDFIMTSLADFPPYVPEEQNPDILVRGRWLERGGSAWIVSTAGTGKSIHSVQLALSWTAGKPFSGLNPLKPLKIWVIQSEDSPSRVTIDREDVIAELKEMDGDVDWRKMAGKISFLKFPGKVGAEFLDALDNALTVVEDKDRPDVVILNPFMAFIGGPVSDSAYVTPFLRGGELNRQPTCGLQDILERHRVAALVYHHTPKPPTEKELKAWMSSTFPEYQGAGSSDITNWGRSFITMMKVENHPGVVCLTAGKNGNELGWQKVGGAYRHYLAYSEQTGITGRGRHAWREMTAEELQDITGTDAGEKAVLEMVEEIRQELREHAMFTNEIRKRWGDGKAAKTAREMIIKNPDKYHITKRSELVGGQWREYFGLTDGISEAVKIAREEYEIRRREWGQKDE